MAHQLFHLPRSTAISDNLTLIAGARVRFYLSTTVTPTPVYQDSARTTPHTQPVEADAAGRLPEIYLDPSIVYRATFTDSADVEIYPAVDPVNDQVLSASAVNALLTQTGVGLVLYPHTAAEVAAGVAPVNYAYSPLNVLRYGAAGDGVTNDAPAFQAAINVAKISGGTVIIPSPPTSGQSYLLTTALDCTNSSSANKPGWGIRGDYGPTTGGIAEILIKHTGHAFDCSGNYGITFADLHIRTDASTQPKTIFFLARNNTGANSQFMRFRNVTVVGYCTNSIVYNYGSEDEIYESCSFWNYATAAGTRVITWTATNISSLTSTFITIATGSQSTIDHQVIGGQFANQAGTATTDIFYIEGGVQGVKIFGPWVSCGIPGSTGGRSIIYVDMTNAASGLCFIYGLQVEHAGGGANQQQYGILFSNHVQTVTNWTINGGTWDNQVAFLAAAGANPTLDSFSISYPQEIASHGIIVPGILTSSTLVGVQAATVGTSSKNLWVGFQVNYTFTTKANDIVLDTFTGGLGLHGIAAPTQVTGFGTPTGNLVINNYPGATATLLQTSQTLAEILIILKGMGVIGA